MEPNEKFLEGQEVDVTYSECGYHGTALVVGKVFGNKWLVKLPEEDESSFPKVFSVQEQHLKEIRKKETTEPKRKESQYELLGINSETIHAVERKTKRKERREKAQHRAAPQGRR